MLKSSSKLFLLIIICGVVIRLINITQPLLEGGSTRQVQTAMVARNFYSQGFKLFYPQVDNFGDNPGYLMQEFYILPFIAALAYKLLGGVHEWVLRLLSFLSFIAAVIMLYKLASYYFNKKIGLISAFCFSISPLSIYLGRAVHPEMLMIFFNMATLYAFSRWIYEDRNIYALWAVISFILAVLLKVPNLYLLLPIMFILFTKYNWNFIGRPKLWIFLIVSLIPIGLLNYHQHLVRAAFPNPAMTNFQLEYILRYIRIYLAGKMFYKVTFDNLITYTLTPMGFSLFLIGTLFKVKEKREWVFYLWLLSAAVFFLIMPAQSIQGYYQIHLLPIACIFMAKATSLIMESRVLPDNLLSKKILLPLLFFMIFIPVFRYSYAYYRIPENFRYVVETGEAVDRLTEKDALIIASIENGPDLVYYSNRKGWPFMIDREACEEEERASGEKISRIYNRIKYLEFLRSRGADYFASASMKEFTSHKIFSEYMFNNYKVVKKTPNYIIFDIRQGRKRE